MIFVCFRLNSPADHGSHVYVDMMSVEDNIDHLNGRCNILLWQFEVLNLSGMIEPN